MEDVMKHGSQPVPQHLRSATGRQRRDTGDGAGYLYPHDFEDADVDQQYLPDLLQGQGRRYYFPSDQGAERRMGEFMEARRARRAEGRPKRVPQPGGDPMAGMGDGMKAHTEARKKLAETQKRDANAE
jgi:hypothetical protein